MFNWVQVRRLTRPLKNIYLLLIQSFQCGFIFVLQIIVFLKCESPTQSQIHGWLKQVFIEDSPLLCSVHCPFYPDKLASPCWWKSAQSHDDVTTMLDRRDGVDWVTCSVRLALDLTLWIETKMFNFCLVWPQNISPHAYSIIKMLFSQTSYELLDVFFQ